MNLQEINKAFISAIIVRIHHPFLSVSIILLIIKKRVYKFLFSHLQANLSLNTFFLLHSSKKKRKKN